MTYPEPIAIIGTGCRFPGSSCSPSKLWDLLRCPRNVASKVPADRFNIDAFYHPDGSMVGTTNVKESYFLSGDIRRFDAPFFNISVSEAASIDPQQRLLLETVYESLEAAGLPLHTLQGSSTGVFCGVMNDDFAHLLGLDSKSTPQYVATGVARTNLANRVSYFFNWHGPSFTVDTACSSSMVALHQAVGSLRTGESGMAVVTGVNLIFSPNMYISASTMHMLSPTGRCKMWDAGADGYARGEGVASIVLKRLQDAVAAGDPIECVIRSTGTNQDGRTMGITMPSNAAQLQLIRSTYAAAGLDPVNRPEDRCQYFEAHGTGTLAGDPQEASAVYNAFFHQPDSTATSAHDQLYVGSIKTVIGHTEGTAGLAGIIKASLCLQHGKITPNLHFNNANPELSKFTSRLVVPTEEIPWPQLAPGAPRRISVNSFGFGGTNAHAVLESYETPPISDRLTNGTNGANKTNGTNGTNGLSIKDTLNNIVGVLPFVFSAASERALTIVLQRYLRYVQDHPLVHTGDLAWSLLSRRSVFTYRLVLWAPSVDELGKKIEEQLRQQDNKLPIIISRPTNDSRKTLGSFTGQGAQWSQMALGLVDSCPAAGRWFEAMQYSLDQLPKEYRPDFSLVDELRAEESSSRLSEPIISQALCTAVQIVQVNMLSALGISFSAVVGHSSGEIAAAYATGALSAFDAIRIAYLRGWVVNHADGLPGAMMAAGLSMDEAIGICMQEEYKGRITVAACNSPSSVTLSGDRDAIYQLQKRLKEKEMFTRLLRVKTAYHSHHMSLCSGRYLRALEACNIQSGSLGTTQWYSSVYGGKNMNDSADTDSLSCQYWVTNMTKPVLFQQALATAVTDNNGLPIIIVEVGPHHSLKGPALQTLSSTGPSARNISYIGLLSRGEDGIKTMAKAIGSLWATLPPGSIGISQYAALFNPGHKPRFLRDLPAYPFDHGQIHWFETRQMKANWKTCHKPNPLLGSMTQDCEEGEWRWRHYLRQNEIKWLDGHQVDSQTIFPATGFISMAIEACNMVSKEMQRNMQLVQVHQLIIDSAISFTKETDGVEVLFRLDQIDLGNALRKCASGQITITWGEDDTSLLPSKQMGPDGKFTAIDVDKFYESLEQLGYKYSGAFRGLISLDRSRDRSSGVLSNHIDSQFLLHPASLDTGLQTLLAAFEAPGDGRLSTLYIPTRIESTTINLNAGGPLSANPTLAFDASISGFNPSGFSGDVLMYTADGHGAIQFEGVHVSPLVPPTQAHDRSIFSTVVWSPLQPEANWQNVSLPQVWFDNIDIVDHIAFLYIKDVSEQLTEADGQKFNWHQSRIVEWIDHVISLTRSGQHPVCLKTWLDEKIEDVSMLLSTLGGIEAIILQSVGENLLGFLRGKVSMLEVLRKDDILGRFYKDSTEANVMNERLGNIVAQIAFRFPRMRILEVGAGTGSATSAALNRIGRSYHSYTFTDISAAFFEEAEEAFTEHNDRFIFRVLDLEHEPVAQGFEEHSYDLVLAANVLHATKSLEQTLHRVRRLLKPGGYLVALEGTNLDIIRITFSVCAFEGWWLGKEDGRRLGALASRDAWEILLRRTGFGGFETITSLDDPRLSGYSVFVSQADDAHICRLREPLGTAPFTMATTANEAERSQDLIVVGGSTELTSPLVASLNETIAPYFHRIIHISKAENLFSHHEPLPSSPIVLTLADIDEPCFRDLSEIRLQALKLLVGRAQKLLWVTVGSEAKDPYLCMSRGFLHSLRYERPQCMFQHLNVVEPSALNVRALATTLMRLAHAEFPNDYTLSNAVESVEPDLRLEDGRMKIARLRNEDTMNKRYNSCRRSIQVPVSLHNVVVRVNWRKGPSRWTLVEDRPQKGISAKENQGSDQVSVVVSYSTLFALRATCDNFLHLVIGRNAQTNARVLALSDQHASVISAPECYCIELTGTGIADYDDAVILQSTATAMLAIFVLEATTPGKGLLVHEANAALKKAIQAQAATKNVRPVYTTCILHEGQTPEIRFLHPRCSTRKLIELIPRDVSTTARFDNEADCPLERVKGRLGEDVGYLDMASLSRPTAVPSKGGESRQVAANLQLANHLSSELVDSCQPISPVCIDMLSDTPVDALSDLHLQIVDWTQSEQVLVYTQQASAQVNLSAHKTYLLVGMTGDLGQSVCHWMITRGARNLVLTSRTPKVEVAWLEEMANLGATVIPMTMDVTDRESVEGVDRIIRQQLPAVGGVINGAMVLTDGVFSELSLEDIQGVFRPKIEGSLVLDELYGDDDLEFFILFGSRVGVFGNWGQSAYAAATDFLSGLIHRRRQRNLVGSVIHPGEVQGVGYVSRKGPSLLQHMKNTLGNSAISENDLNELFAEAILAGNPSTCRNPDIVAGMTVADPLKQPDIIWYQNPKAWEFIDYHTESMASQAPSAEVPLRVQLEAAETNADAKAIIRASFVSKLHSKLHLPHDKSIPPETQLAELGIDSLVAVDLRMWFAKVIGVDVPVLELLGESSVDRIASSAAEKLRQEADAQV